MLYVGNNEMGAFALLKLSRKMDHIKYEDFPVEPGAKLGDYVDELISDPKEDPFLILSEFHRKAKLYLHQAAAKMV